MNNPLFWQTKRQKSDKIVSNKVVNIIGGITVDYAKLIKTIREKLFLTQTEFAEMLGVSLTTVCRWENKVFEPTMKVKKKIAQICKENSIYIGEKENGREFM